MDKLKETLCGLGGNTLCNIIADGEKVAPKDPTPAQAQNALCGLGGRQLCSLVSDINEISENLTKYEEKQKADPTAPTESLCHLGGRQFCDIISDMNELSHNLNAFEKAISNLGNGDYEQGYKHIIKMSKELSIAREKYPAEMWKQAGKELIAQAVLDKISEIEKAYKENGFDAMMEKVNELGTIRVRILNEEWK